MKKIIGLFAVLLFSCNLFAQENLLDKVTQLQETAKQANGGALGCGKGGIILVTSKGEIKIATNLDPIHVFGRKIKVLELVKLLEARVKSNKGIEKNQMSGDVSDLGYVILSVLAWSKDSKVISVISDLLEDKDEVIRGWSAIALFRLGDSDEKIREEIKKIKFPKDAIQSANARSIKTPEWILQN